MYDHIQNIWKKRPKGSPSIFKGRKHTAEAKEKNRIAHLGMSPSLETRRKISAALRGPRSHLWRGGVTPINMKIRNSVEYKIWRKAVFERDDYTCQTCLKKGVHLHADHIKQFAYHPKLRFAIDNGRTLCIDCHKLTDTYKFKIKKQKYV